MFRGTLINTTGVFMTYQDIKLTTYLEVMNSGDLTKIVISGYPTVEAMEVAWEDIIKQAGKATGSGTFNKYYMHLKNYSRLIAEYNFIRSRLLQLMFVIDTNYIAELKKFKYNINVGGTSYDYSESINKALRKSDNIISKIQLEKSQLESITANSNYVASSAEELLARVSVSLGFSIDSDITLARYNEYIKVIKARQSKQS